ncbi:histidine kinase [Croceicoccus estronivorus]|nr:histidine kinase [Croceicoccus estronivorus]
METPDTPIHPEHRPRRLFWTRRASLTTRILAVNIIALALLAGSLFYLDSYRKQLLAERFKLAQSEAQITAEALVVSSPERQRTLLLQLGKEQRLRLRLYNKQGKLVADSFELAGPSFTLTDPATEPWYQEAARILDKGMDALLGAPPIPPYQEPDDLSASAWPELEQARAEMRTHITLRYAPDRTPVISAAAPVGTEGAMLLTTRNAIDITQDVRDARQTLAIIVAIALAVSIQLSLFLARTIVQPLRTLVRAAVRVRLGRDREVEVPRLPERRDEIGMLARAISDMTGALRQRIDAVEHFAADVAHEIKNPLASLRSALDSLDKVSDPELRRQLTAIAIHDVRRIDRLVTEIADASRIDAELSRATFEVIDIEKLIANAIGAREDRGENAGRIIRLERRGAGPAEVLGVPARIERVIENLLDNAVSFSPPDGEIDVIVTTTQERVWAMVCDHGPGIPESERRKVFERFHSIRPEAEDFGQHSGLGLAIAKTIAEAHDGTLSVIDRLDGAQGACLVLDLPLREQP